LPFVGGHIIFMSFEQIMNYESNHQRLQRL